MTLQSFSAEQPSMEEIFLDKVGPGTDSDAHMVLTDEGELVREADTP